MKSIFFRFSADNSKATAGRRRQLRDDVTDKKRQRLLHFHYPNDHPTVQAEDQESFHEAQNRFDVNANQEDSSSITGKEHAVDEVLTKMKQSVDQMEQQGHMYTLQNKAIEQNNQLALKNKQALKELKETQAEANIEKQKADKLVKQQNLIYLAQIEKSLQHQIDMKNTVSDHMKETHLLQDRISRRLDEQSQIIKVQQAIIQNLYSNTNMFKQNQIRLSEGISDYRQTKESLENVSKQVNDLISKSESLTNLVSTIAKETKEELSATKNTLDSNRQSSGNFFDSLSNQVQANNMALEIQRNHSAKEMMELESRIERLHKLNATSYMLRQDLELQTGRINQLKNATYGHNQKFKVLEQLIDTVHDHVQQIKMGKVDQKSFDSLQEKIKKIEAKNEALREKLNMQKVTIQNLDTLIVENVKNVTDTLQKKVSNSEFQSFHQAADMYATKLDEMNKKHDKLRETMVTVGARIQNLSKYQSENMSRLAQKQSEFSKSELDHISNLKSRLDEDQTVITEIQDGIKEDHEQLEKLAKNIGDLGKLANQSKLFGQEQINRLSQNLEQDGKKAASSFNTLSSKINTISGKVNHQKQLLRDLAVNSTAGLKNILETQRTLKRELATQEKLAMQKEIEIAQNRNGIDDNKQRLDMLENKATETSQNYVELNENMQNNNYNLESKLTQSINNQADIKDTLEKQSKNLEEAKNLTETTAAQHARIMMQLINLREKLDEDSSQQLTHFDSEVDRITGSITNASAQILSLKEKNAHFLELLTSMKKYIQRQKQEDDSNLKSMSDKLDSVRAKLNNQRMSAGSQANATRTKIQAIEQNLQTITSLEKNQSVIQGALNAEHRQLGKVEEDVRIQGKHYKEQLKKLADQVEQEVNKALMTKASKVESKKLQASIDSLRESKDNLTSQFLKASASFSKIQSAVSKQLSMIDTDLSKKASTLKVKSLEKVMDMLQNQLATIEQSSNDKIEELSSILKIYSNKINGALEKKETEFQGHLNFSAGLSNSIDDLQKSLKSIEQRIADANNFEKETKSSLLEKIGSDQRKIDSLMATQEKLQELFPTMSKQSDVEALSRAINSTYTDEQNIQKKLNLNMANIQKKLQKQRFLLTSLAEETASGFSNVLTKLGSANVTIKNLKEQLDKQANLIQENAKRIDKNKNEIIANQELAERNNAEINENKQDITAVNSKISDTNQQLLATDKEISNLKTKISSDELISRYDEREIHELEKKEQYLQKKEISLEKTVDTDENRITQLEADQEEESEHLLQTDALLQGVKTKTEMNSKSNQATENKVKENTAFILGNSEKITSNSNLLSRNTANLSKHGKILVEHETKLGEEESQIESQGRDISHFLEGKAQEEINKLTTENSEDANYLVEFGSRNDGMLVSGLIKVGYEEVGDASICVKMKMFSQNGRRNILSLGIKKGLHYEIFLRMIFVMSGNEVDQIQLKHDGVTQVIRLSLKKGEKKHLYCMNQNRFFADAREFQFSSEINFKKYLTEGLSVILGYNDMTSSSNDPVTIMGFDSSSAKGFEGIVQDVSLWRERMEGWSNHRSNLLKDFGCLWNDPEGKKIVDFEKNIITGSKIYGTSSVSSILMSQQAYICVRVWGEASGQGQIVLKKSSRN